MSSGTNTAAKKYINQPGNQLGKLVRSAGDQWNREKKLWELPYKEVINLDLADRIVSD